MQRWRQRESEESAWINSLTCLLPLFAGNTLIRFGHVVSCVLEMCWHILYILLSMSWSSLDSRKPWPQSILRCLHSVNESLSVKNVPIKLRSSASSCDRNNIVHENSSSQSVCPEHVTSRHLYVTVEVMRCGSHMLRLKVFTGLTCCRCSVYTKE